MNTVKGLQVYEQELDQEHGRAREADATNSASDIARFKELKGIK